LRLPSKKKGKAAQEVGTAQFGKSTRKKKKKFTSHPVKGNRTSGKQGGQQELKGTV